MNRTKIILLGLFMSLVVSSAYAQKKNSRGPAFKAIVQKSSDSSLFVIDSVFVRWEKPYFISRDLGEGIAFLKPDSEGKFGFNLPLANELYPFTISFCQGKEKPVPLTGTYLLAEAGDEVTIEISRINGKLSLQFYGKGAEKYNLIGILDSMLNEYANKSWKVVDQAGDWENKMKQCNQVTQEYWDEGNRIINASSLSTNMKKLVAYEFYPIAYCWAKLLIYEYEVALKDSGFKSIIADSYLKNKDRFRYPVDTLMSQAPGYLYAMAEVEVLDLAFETIGDTLKLKDVYTRINSKYKGKTRDIMLANFLTGGLGFKATRKINNGFSNEIIDSLVREAERLVSLPSAKRRLINQLKLGKGAKVPEFLFADLNGNQVSLSSLNGKVVFIDFWGTGCVACSKFHQWFHKEVYPLYKENKDFIYLSLNGDKNKELWKASLQSGKYSSDDYLNLNTGLDGLKHPFAMHYNIMAFPFIVIIGKDGNVYAEAFPPNKGVATRVLDRALNEK